MDRLKLLQSPLPIDGFSDVWSKVTKIIGKERINTPTGASTNP